jgi:hypothetical protein
MRVFRGVGLLEQESAGNSSVSGRQYVENRLVGKALKFWESARVGRELPSVADLETGACPFGTDEMMVIAVGASEEEDRVIAAGHKVAAALGHDPTGLLALDALPSSTEMGLSFCRASVGLKKPMADVGRFFNRKGEEILYRSILLPLSADGVNVDRVVSAFSYKVVH